MLPTFSTSITFPELYLTNSASNFKQSLGRKDLYRIYVCGITPYDATHLGHAATYLAFDLINRYLLASGAQVNYVQNITDIDDPLLERAERDGVDWKDLAQQQIDLFRGDMNALRVIPPNDYIGAVESIPLIATAIQKLKEKASVYLVDSDLYFSVHKDSKFGSRSHLSNPEMLEIFSQRGGDPTRAGKLDPLDCLLWLSKRELEPGWESPFGTGRPGWHIECTAIAIEYLKPSYQEEFLIDIQGGGSDLIFPHHEMCAAQASVISGKEFAHNYVHAGMIGLAGEKMSKSKGNLVLVSKLVSQGTDPMAIRWALLSGSYRADRMWTPDLLSAAQVAIHRLKLVLASESMATTDELISEIVVFLANDLNTPGIFTAIDHWVHRSLSGETGGDAIQITAALDALLGFKF